MDIKLRYGDNLITSHGSRKNNAHGNIAQLVKSGNISPVKALEMLHSPPAPESNGETKKREKEPKPNGAANLETVMRDLNRLVGLAAVKKLIKELQAFITVQRYRADERLVTEPLVLHMIFKGNPGTGKTTIARIIGELFREINVLPKGHLIEVERADLVGEYIGHTAQRTREMIKKALGGILFIDEAYSLARGGEKDFGKEAIDVLVKAMEDHKDNFVLILAGYKKEMDWFLLTNPGLRSRFAIHMDFPDYSIDELMEIADIMAKKREYHLSEKAREELRRTVEKQVTCGHEHSGNARLVRNILEKAIRRQAVRLVKRNSYRREDLMTLSWEDILEAADYDA